MNVKEFIESMCEKNCSHLQPMMDYIKTMYPKVRFAKLKSYMTENCNITIRI